ncbi:MAG TPA: hypothetical protein VE986_02790 [Hyphomicrobiales bacterium]|nr:hypothetical protein [Hyphomicrobiales bacterium]
MAKKQNAAVPNMSLMKPHGPAPMPDKGPDFAGMPAAVNPIKTDGLRVPSIGAHLPCSPYERELRHVPVNVMDLVRR